MPLENMRFVWDCPLKVVSVVGFLVYLLEISVLVALVLPSIRKVTAIVE